MPLEEPNFSSPQNMTADYSPPLTTYSNGKLSIDKTQLAEAHLVNGREFPVAYALNLHGNDFNQKEVETFLAKLSQDGIITQLIENHGAFVLRDSVPDSNDSKVDSIAAIIRLSKRAEDRLNLSSTGHWDCVIRKDSTYTLLVNHRLKLEHYNTMNIPDSRNFQIQLFSQSWNIPRLGAKLLWFMEVNCLKRLRKNYQISYENFQKSV